jgi:hypothetical protein
MDPQSVVTLNVGGFVFVTRRATLLQSSTYFEALARHNPDCAELFVDRDATHFRHVLNWLRGVRVLPEDDATLRELECEADFYAMPDLVRAIGGARHRYSLPRAVHELAHTMRTAR